MVTVITALIVVCLVFPKSEGEVAFWPSFTSQSRMMSYSSAAVSSDAAPCAPIGRDVLERNGTAVDAAIAMLVCMGAHNPQSMGLGGGFLMLYYNRSEQKAYYLDSREVAPRRSTVDMFQGNKSRSSEGSLSIAVPGELAGYSEAYRRFGGGLPWKDLFIPTIKMCRRGIVVSFHLEMALKQSREKLMRNEAISKVFLKNFTDIYTAGERIKMLDLARTLEVISIQGARALYGPSKLAGMFLGDMKAAGSIIDRIDMQSYTPRLRKTLQARLRKNTTLHSVSLPGSGALLALMMNILDGYPDMDESVVHNKELAILTFHRMVETFKYAYGRRSELEDEDSEEMENLVDKLTSQEYADSIREEIDDSKTFNDPLHYNIKSDFLEDHGTSHLSLVAPNGDAVSVTSTINHYFGSKVMSPSTGIILNNEMDDFSSPNITNGFNLPPSKRNLIRPGKRPISSMCPMILVDADGNVTLVLGAAGGTMITTSVLQVAVRNLFFGEDIKQAIDAPRIHHQLLPNTLRYDKGFPIAMVENLHKFGHHTEMNKDRKSIVNGVKRDENFRLYANSDYRKGGDVDGF